MKQIFTTVRLNKGINVILFLLIGVYAILLTDVFGSDGYLPFHEDETINYNSGRLFYETNSLKAPVCIAENISAVLGSNWYGMFFNLFYGSIAKIVGFGGKYFIVINALLLVLGFYVLSRFDIPSFDKKLFTIIVLLLPNIGYYVFGYWPVIINAFLTFPLIYLLFMMNKFASEGLNYRQIQIKYLALCFIYIIVNPVWAFWSVGILPFYKRKGGILVSLMVIGLITGSAFLYIKFFCAPWFAGSTNLVGEHLKKGEFRWVFIIFYEKFISNFGLFFRQNLNLFEKGQIFDALNQILLLGFLLISPITYIFRRDKFNLSISIISILIILVLITLYTYDFRFLNRLYTPSLLLILFGIFSTGSGKLKTVVCIILLMSFPFSMIKSVRSIKEREKIYAQSQNEYKAAIRDLTQIKYLLNSDKPAIVQWVYYDYRMPKSLFNINLPLSDSCGNPVLYTAVIGCGNPSDCDTMKYEKKLERFGRLKVNYAIVKEEVQLDDYRLLYDSKEIKLYEIK